MYVYVWVFTHIHILKVQLRNKSLQKMNSQGNSLAVQWLGLCALTAEGLGSIPGRGTKPPQATWRGQKKTQQN